MKAMHVSSRATNVALVTVALIWALVRVGPALLPDIPGWVAHFGTWTSQDLPLGEGRWKENLLHQWIYAATGSSGPIVWLIESSILMALAVILMAYVAAGGANQERQFLGIRLVLLSPVVAIFFGFLGSYDGLTAILQLLVVIGWLKKSLWMMLAAGTLLGLHHPFQGILSLLLLLLTLSALYSRGVYQGRRANPLWGLLGVAVGKAVAASILYVTTGSMSGSRPYDVLAHFLYLRSSADFFPIILYSFFAGLWVLIILVWLAQRGLPRLLLMIGFLLCSVLTLTDADKTRLFVILALPSIAVIIRWFVESDRFTARETRLVEVAAWVLPPVLIWETSEGMGLIQHLGWIDQFIMSWQLIAGW